MFGIAYVQLDKLQLMSVREDFEKRAAMFLSDYKTRRILDLSQPRKPWPLASREKSLSWHEATVAFERNTEEQHHMDLVRSGVQELRDVFAAASASPESATFSIPVRDISWFLPLNRSEEAAFEKNPVSV